MTTTQRWTIAIIAVIAIGVALFAGGIALGRTGWAMPFGTGNMTGGYAPNQTGVAQMPYGYMMSGSTQAVTGTVPYDPGMMTGGFGGMMGYAQNYTGTGPYGPGMMNGGHGGTMSNGMMGSNGMMSGLGSSQLSGVKPLALDQAKKAVADYVTRFSNPDLIVSEIMIFDNNAYARITEKSTGIGAFEVLVDPVTLAVYPEYGPNMMWNLKYSSMVGFGGMMGTGMRGGSQPAPQANGQMPVSADQALQAAQRYLDTYLPGAKADAKPDPFYGYYTLDILRDGKTVDMLSVNGYTQQVFLHTWHGNFIEMSED